MRSRITNVQRGGALVVAALGIMLSSLATAQTPAAAPRVQMTKPASELLIVDKQGHRQTAPKDVELRLRSQVLTEPATVGDLLQRNGLAHDANTVEMLKRLNPSFDFSDGKLPRGAKVNMFAPYTPGGGADSAVTFDSPLVAKFALRENAIQAERVHAVATQLPRARFDSDATFESHRNITSSLDNAGKVLLERADTINATDLAVAQYVLDSAVRRAAAVNARALDVGKVNSSDLQLLERTAAPTQTMTMRLESGQTPLPLRRVKVSLLRENSSEDVKGLQVYVLPAGILNAPALYSEQEVQNYLTRFSFVDETSPATQDVPLFDARVWVGPKFKMVEMSRMVKQGQLRKFLSIDDPDLLRPTAELVFRAPADVVTP